MKTFQKKLSVILIAAFFGGINNLSAQEDSTQSYKPYNMKDESKPSFGQRLVFGGNLGFQFGTQTIIEVSPIIGYKITEQLIGGIGIKYLYFKTQFYYGPTLYKYSTNIYGGSVFGRYYVTPNFFAHAEYEVINLDVPKDFSVGYMRANVTSIFLGGGYSQQIGDHASAAITLLYNIAEEKNTPYENPILRIGFGFGF